MTFETCSMVLVTLEKINDDLSMIASSSFPYKFKLVTVTLALHHIYF